MIPTDYAPGACNIGPAEIARRRNMGWLFLGISIATLAILILLNVSQWWHLIIFLPATVSASGFLQAHFHFCSGFASRGVYNFGTLGHAQAVADAAAKKLDRQRGLQITLYAVAAAAVVALLAVLI